MTSAVLEIGGAEYPFTRGSFGWRAGDENVGFSGDGRCVFRGGIYVISEYTLWLPRTTIDLLRTKDPLVPMPLANVNIKPIEDRPAKTDRAKGTIAEVRSWCPMCDVWHAGNDHVTKPTAPTATGVFEAMRSGILDTYDNKFELVDGKFYVGIHEVKFAHNGACQFRALDTFLLPNEYVLWVPRYMIDPLRSMNKNVSLKPIEERPAPAEHTTVPTDLAARIIQLQKDHDVYVSMHNEDLTRLTGRIAKLEEQLEEMLRTRVDDAPVIV